MCDRTLHGSRLIPDICSSANQFIAIQKLVYFAKLTNRVAIMCARGPAHWTT